VGIAEQVALASAIASAVSTIFAAFAAWQARRQVSMADKAAEATVFLEISRSWNDIYPKYRELVSWDFRVGEVIKTTPKFDDYALTDDWKLMRPVFAFYEFLGASIRMGLLKEHTLFSLVVVNVSLWEKYSPLIVYFRDESERRDLYLAWEYLVERRLLYAPGKEHLPLRRNLLARFLGRASGG
jgi:hypothetical protein